MRAARDREFRSRWSATLHGMCAGCIATLPMSLVMVAGNRRHARGSPAPLPPQHVMEELGHNPGHRLQGMDPASWLAHFTFGSAAGGIYPTICRQPENLSILKGMAYGLAVWTVHYGVGFPVLGLRCAANQETRERNLTMLGAHLVWGAALGMAFRPVPGRVSQSSNRRRVTSADAGCEC